MLDRGSKRNMISAKRQTYSDKLEWKIARLKSKDQLMKEF